MRLQNMRVVCLLSLFFALLGGVASIVLFDLNWWLVWDFYICSYLIGYIKLFCWPLIKDILLFLHQLLTLIMPGSRGIPVAHQTVAQLTTNITTPDGQTYVIRTIDFLNHPW